MPHDLAPLQPLREPGIGFEGRRQQRLTLPKWFLRSALSHPERPALWVDGAFYRYRDLHAAAARLAATILAGAPRSEAMACRQCAVLVGRSFTAYAGILGALYAGCAYVPLNPKFPAARLLSILAASEADTLIVDRASMAAAETLLTACRRPLTVLFAGAGQPPDWAAATSRHRYLCGSDIDSVRPLAQPLEVAGEQGAYLLFTSGSTGNPKGVLISHDNADAYLRAVSQRYRPAPEDRFTQLFDFSFDLSVHDMFACWGAGACLYCPPAGATMSPRDFVRRHELTFWFSVPSTAATMARLRMLEPGDFPTLRVSLFCGEALPTALASKWRDAAPASLIENLYGPTEATIAITACRVEDGLLATGSRPVVPIGEPFPGQFAVVVDAEGRLLGDGEPGELCLGGSQVAAGYWRTPEATARRFLPPIGFWPEGDSWFRTGDRVVRDPRYGLVFLGRLDRQAKIRGHRIELSEIETAVGETAAALAWPPGDAEPSRYIVLFVAGEGSASAVLDRCRPKLPAPLVPREVRFLRDWPLNAHGKTDYAALKQLLMAGHG